MTDLEDVDTLPTVAAALDTLRAEGLKSLDLATAAREAGLRRDHEHLERRLGRDHPRVRRVAARIDAATTLRHELTMEVARAETPSPRVGTQEWALHGYVRWADLSPASDVTVSLVDANGQWHKSLGYACTDTRGYFHLHTQIAVAADGIASILSVSIRVTDGDRRELYRGKDALAVLPGVVDYREILLAGGGRVCVAPEAEGTPGPAAARARPAQAGKSRRAKSSS